jgi:hypothetical protein
VRDGKLFTTGMMVLYSDNEGFRAETIVVVHPTAIPVQFDTMKDLDSASII